VEVRLQKLLADAGLASRRAAEEWIRAGRVRVNGTVASIGDRADPAHDDVRVDGKRIAAEPLRYWLLHKPKNVLTTNADPWAEDAGRRTVLELLPAAARRTRLYPVGRLDLNSEGLLLLTNDGALAQALLHPSHGCEREYHVEAWGELTSATARQLAAGVELDDGRTGPCRVRRTGYDRVRGLTRLEIVLREGRKRQIRRSLRALDHPVRRLVRVRMGPLRLGELSSGRSRRLTAAELASLKRLVRAVSRGGKPASKGAREPSRPTRRSSRPTRRSISKPASKAVRKPASKSVRKPAAKRAHEPATKPQGKPTRRRNPRAPRKPSRFR
jgi:23S rRNA pseudouridine2605 synthase